MITVDSNIEFSTAYIEIEGYEGEIDEDGIIDIEVPCSCGGVAMLSMDVKHLTELVHEVKKFRDRRITFRALRDREKHHDLDF